MNAGDNIRILLAPICLFWADKYELRFVGQYSTHPNSGLCIDCGFLDTLFRTEQLLHLGRHLQYKPEIGISCFRDSLCLSCGKSNFRLHHRGCTKHEKLAILIFAGDF